VASFFHLSRVVCVCRVCRVWPARTQAKAGGAQLLGDAGDDERLEREEVRDAAVGLVYVAAGRV
jgi:hypothetical protein